jgi:hypothetical protein
MQVAETFSGPASLISFSISLFGTVLDKLTNLIIPLFQVTHSILGEAADQSSKQNFKTFPLAKTKADQGRLIALAGIPQIRISSILWPKFSENRTVSSAFP